LARNLQWGVGKSVVNRCDHTIHLQR